MPSEASMSCADQVRRRTSEELERELAETREQQVATAEILRVISSSPIDLQGVFANIAASAARLCDAYDATIFQVDGDNLRIVAHHGPIPPGGTLPLTRGYLIGRAVLDRRTIQVADLPAESDDYPEGSDRARRLGHRTILAVPLIRAGEAVGAIAVRRTEIHPFTDRQVELLKIFADQAVIAIENARLFEAEHERTMELTKRTRELSEALEYQTATADVLAVISRSKSDAQLVFDAIVKSTAKLFDPCSATITMLKDDQLHWHASAAVRESDLVVRAVRSMYPLPFDLERSPSTRAITERKIIEIPDATASGTPAFARRAQQTIGFRSMTYVPLVREEKGLGTIILTHPEPGFRLSVKQRALVQTFADQAVIAIENARVLNELRESLQQQTATSDVLKVISRSTFDLQMIFQKVAESACRLCAAEHAFVYRFDGKLLRVVVAHNASPELTAFAEQNPITPGRHSGAARAALEGRTIHIHDVRADPEYTFGAKEFSLRSLLAVPMQNADDLLGVILIYRNEVFPFNESQVALMETFADEAVIAIENTRLFEEVQARNRDLVALGDVGRAVSSTLDLKVVLKTIVDRAVALSGTDAGSIFYYRDDLGRFELGETSGLGDELIARYRKLDIATGQTGLGEAIANRQPLQIPDVLKRPSNVLRDAAFEAGLHAALIVPLLGSDSALGALVLQRGRTGEFSPAVVNLMQSFADQSAIALDNARLFEEIERKGRELEIASQHKSQFVANMSHELRTPLAAILGYAELMQEGFYEPIGQKSLDALTRIRSNGRHLLGLINTVLDIAKIESGQFSLNLAEYAIESVVETVRVATESLAQYKKLELKTDVTKSLPVGVGDEQRLTQVLLNLVGNAIKFTEVGEVRITAKAVNGHFNITVADTGPGIPPAEQTRIFEQFHQVDSSLTKAKGGTGLGLAIAKQIVEMHGGRIWVESTVGEGSTFQMEVPTRAEFRKLAL
jgi:signal transduction histidine kinase